MTEKTLQRRREEARVEAVALFGTLVDGDRQERALIEAILAAASRQTPHLAGNVRAWTENQIIVRRAEALLRFQTREDSLHRLGNTAVTRAQNERHPQAS